MYPKIEVHLDHIRENAGIVVKLCGEKGIEVMGVTKGVCAIPDIVKAMLDGGVKKLGDSRLLNISAIREAGFNVPIYLIRIPMISEIPELVDLADGSLNSEVSVIKAISEEANARGKTHRVILMVDVGDLREGVMPEDVLDTVGEIIDLPGIELEGIGTNMGCYGGVLPTYENTKLLVEITDEIEKVYGIKMNTISGGSTATLKLMSEDSLARGVNQLRIGEGILLGTDSTNDEAIAYLSQDTMVLKTEVIEVKVKPSVPIGKIGKDSFGNVPVFKDRGLRKRAIVALGKQDCRIEGLIPKQEGIEILGASSDHMLLDVTETGDVKVGDIIDFSMSYSAMLSLMTSKYVEVSLDRPQV
ncbi:MAG: alanine/ornithine racemase family PLP-dependent enzyme [Thermoanaerobacteraceae bacterium]|nr:alanine/ornithine racemase family PLP-dependent enzyme [Thermoanaerobacteraceae bacterium]